MLQRERGRTIGWIRSQRASRHMGDRAGRAIVSIIATAILVPMLGGCATKGELLALEERVIDAERKTKKGPDPFERIAALSAEVEALRSER